MTIEYASGPTVMMTLGAFQFGIQTAAYQELSRVTEWRWPAQERFMQGQALQYVGPGGDTITLPGVIYPEYRGGFGQLDAMRTVADDGEPLVLIDGQGNIMGSWVIERLEEKQTVFAAAGRPRKQEFTLNLRKYDSEGVGTVAASVVGSSASAASMTPGLFGGALKAAGSTVASLASSLGGSIASVTAVAGDLAGMASQVLAPVQAAYGTARNLANSINDAQRMLGMKPTKFTAVISAGKVVNAATSAAANAGQFGRTLSRVAADLRALGTVPASSMAVVDNAVVNVNRLTVGATTVQRDATKSQTELNAS